MTWNDDLTQLRDMLVDLYPTLKNSQRVVDEAGIPRARILFSTTAVENWHAILTEANHRGKILDIIEVVRKDYPESTKRLLEEQTSNLQPVLRVIPDGLDTCREPVIFPSEIDPVHRPDEAREQIMQAHTTSEIWKWRRVPTDQFHNDQWVRNVIKIQLRVSSFNQQDWVKVDNTIFVDIKTFATPLNHVNALQDCAGAGEIRYFTPVFLNSHTAGTQLKTFYPDCDYFSLQPGEFEVFNLQFHCVEPGIYSVKIRIPWSKNSGESGLFTLDLPDFVFPLTYTTWSMLGNLQANACSMYQWNGSDYISTPVRVSNTPHSSAI
jgi:hypothetical protein